MRLATVVLGTTALLAISPANAGHFNGWYIGLEAGATWNSDNSAAFGEVVPNTLPVDINYDTGWAVLGTMGYAFANSGWRIEGEFGYRDNDIDNINGVRTGGEHNTMSLMANVLYDIPLTDRFALTLGAGAGGVHQQFDDGLLDQDEDINFAYQGIAGLSYAIGQRTDLTLNYRYMRTDEASFHGAHAGHTDFYDLDDGESHTVTVGLRFDLSPDSAPIVQAAEPPPVPAAAPPPAAPPAPRQFLVFFGFNKSTLTSDAMRVISEAANAAKQDGAAMVKVVGHADSVGSTDYNQRLSERRAGAVRGALVDQGIESSKITASGKGETELLVQTGDNVKEPQNRRATIDLQ